MPDAPSRLDSGEVLDLLASLVQKSLVLYEEDEQGQGRYRLLEPTRQYAGERLLEAGEVEAVRERHRDRCLALTEQAIAGKSQRPWHEQLEREHDNLRAAMTWSAAQGESEAALRLGQALWPFWAARGYWTEGREHLAGLLALPGAEPRTAARADVLHGAALLARHQADYEAARTLAEEGLALFRDADNKRAVSRSLGLLANVAFWQGNYRAARARAVESLAIVRQLGDKEGVALSLNELGIVARVQGEYGEARALLEEGLAIFRELGHKYGIAVSFVRLAHIALDQGDYEAAWACYKESLAIFREVGANHGTSTALVGIGSVARRRGDYEAARGLLRESLEIKRKLGEKRGIAMSLGELGSVALSEGDYRAAGALFRESLAIFQELGGKGGIVKDLEGLAAVCATHGQAKRATCLFGAAEGLREAMGAPLPPAERAEHDRSVAAVRTALGAEAFAAAWAEGRAMPLEDAVASALEESDG